MVRIIELDEIFPSYHEAADRINGNRGCVYLCLQGMRASHKGYTFEYVKDLYPIFD
nr:MAG TPA: PROTEIN/DNA Complex catalytic motif, Helix-turn-helix DNA [Caudoviricetes sp.]